MHSPSVRLRNVIEATHNGFLWSKVPALPDKLSTRAGLSGATEYLNVANNEILIGYIISIDNLKTTGWLQDI